MPYTAAVITVSDKGAAGERQDTSGPAICAMLTEAGYEILYTAIVPDEKQQIIRELLHCADDFGCSLVTTTGGTGFSPRDVTPEATLEVLERLTPGIPEAMRAESMKITPHGCLSRETAGIRGRTLIINLPGSKKASTENLAAVLKAVRHGIDMLHSTGSADCGEAPGKNRPAAGSSVKPGKNRPSADEWLREAKQAAGASGAGMYLIHNGVVRATARAAVRDGAAGTKPVTGMHFSYDKDKAGAAVEETLRLPGICFARAWLNEGSLKVGDDIMMALVGGDIRPHVIDGLTFLVGKLKTECVTEKEDF